MKALFAGSFDPFTTGHLSIVERALKFCDHIVIGIGYNEHKRGEWSVEERLEAIRALFMGMPEITVEAFTGLTIDFAKKTGADILLRGVRSTIDFEYERNLADANRALSGLETILLYTLPELSFVSASLVRELIHNGKDASQFIAGDFPLKIEK